MVLTENCMNPRILSNHITTIIGTLLAIKFNITKGWFHSSEQRRGNNKTSSNNIRPKAQHKANKSRRTMSNRHDDNDADVDDDDEIHHINHWVR
ncbi:hypothetical protein E3N88_11883 [Mikania micrantha]|uniref:Uncharacterized protein n=1 Tax=Mikania micrantha TaxID=192012 RepID=A0A5N6P3Y0_9ASTR|nr:hypothetical protein E3N88_11883 [Mikania micrantha]